jgi:hypothetical protein
LITAGPDGIKERRNDADAIVVKQWQSIFDAFSLREPAATPHQVRAGFRSKTLWG